MIASQYSDIYPSSIVATHLFLERLEPGIGLRFCSVVRITVERLERGQDRLHAAHRARAMFRTEETSCIRAES